MNTTYTLPQKSQGTSSSFPGSALANLANSPALTALRGFLVQQLSNEFPNISSGLISEAVLEAYSLAMLTTVPQLVLPVLAEEKLQNLRAWAVRQPTVRRSLSMAIAA